MTKKLKTKFGEIEVFEGSGDILFLEGKSYQKFGLASGFRSVKEFEKNYEQMLPHFKKFYPQNVHKEVWIRRKTKIPEWKKDNVIIAVDHERLSKEDKTKVWKVSTGNKKHYAYRLLRYFDTKKEAMKYAKDWMKRN